MKRLLSLLMLTSLALSACSVGPRPDVEATVQAAIAATQSAAPAAPPPQATPIPPPITTLILLADNPDADGFTLEVLQGIYQLGSGAKLAPGSGLMTIEHEQLALPPGLAIDAGPGGVTWDGQFYPAGSRLYVGPAGQVQVARSGQPGVRDPAAVLLTGDPVVVIAQQLCQPPTITTADEVLVRVRWRAATAELAESNADHLTPVFLFDGQDMGDMGAYRQPAQAYSSLAEYSCDTGKWLQWIHWDVPLGRLPAGTHTVAVDFVLDQARSDGFEDYPAGPLGFLETSFQVLPAEQAQAPTRRPTSTTMPAPTPKPTHTPRPTATSAKRPTPSVAASPPPAATAVPEPKPAIRPATGLLVSAAQAGGRGELLIKNGTDADALIILASLDDQPVLSAYIRAAESFNMTGIPDGTYRLYFSKGEGWDSEANRFMQNVSYQRFEATPQFATTETQYTSYEVTLYGVAGGTASTEQVDPGQFPGVD